jgi:hypothetical protein
MSPRVLLRAAVFVGLCGVAAYAAARGDLAPLFVLTAVFLVVVGYGLAERRRRQD